MRDTQQTLNYFELSEWMEKERREGRKVGRQGGENELAEREDLLSGL